MPRLEQPRPYSGDVRERSAAVAAPPPVTGSRPALTPSGRPEQPRTYPGDLAAAGAARLHRVYRDPLGRPLSGEVTITGATRTAAGGHVVVPAPVTVKISDGVLEVNLPPDTYQLQAPLRTADGARVQDADTVTLGPH